MLSFAQLEAITMSITGGVARLVSSITDSEAYVRLAVNSLDYAYPTYVYRADTVTFNAGTTLVSLFNAIGGTPVKLAIRSIRIHNRGLTGGGNEIATVDFERFTTIHTGGTIITPVARDSADTASLSTNITCRQGGTTTAGSIMRTFSISADEWAGGTLDLEGLQAVMSQMLTTYHREDHHCKPIIIRPGEGLRIHNSAKSGGGSDGRVNIEIVVTQEPN